MEEGLIFNLMADSQLLLINSSLMITWPGRWWASH